MIEFLAAVADVSGTIAHDDENYDFFDTTIRFSTQELYCEHMGEELTFFICPEKKSRPCNYEDVETVYDFTCFVEANISYSINDPKLVTALHQGLTLSKEKIYNYAWNGEYLQDDSNITYLMGMFYRDIGISTPQNSLLRPTLAHMTGLTFANGIWNRFMFLAIPRWK